MGSELLAHVKSQLLNFGALEVSWIDIEGQLSLTKSDVYKAWLDKGYAGEMGYLKRGLDSRKDPRILFPEAKSLIVALFPYSAEPIQKTGPQFARYTRSGDYHVLIKNHFLNALSDTAIAFKSSGLKWKICVDTSAILERSWAALSGLGWIGKNGMLIHPKHGSYFFIGIALLNIETLQGARPLKDYCGNCSRCLKHCPTLAILDDRLLDSLKCISYQTLEKRAVINNPINPNNWVAGCDLCQEICPFNFKIQKHSGPQLGLTPQSDFSWLELLLETEVQYKARTQGSALNRIKYLDFKRNILLSMRGLNIWIDVKNATQIALLLEPERPDLIYLLREMTSMSIISNHRP